MLLSLEKNSKLLRVFAEKRLHIIRVSWHSGPNNHSNLEKLTNGPNGFRYPKFRQNKIALIISNTSMDLGKWCYLFGRFVHGKWMKMMIFLQQNCRSPEDLTDSSACSVLEETLFPQPMSRIRSLRCWVAGGTLQSKKCLKYS